MAETPGTPCRVRSSDGGLFLHGFHISVAAGRVWRLGDPETRRLIGVADDDGLAGTFCSLLVWDPELSVHNDLYGLYVAYMPNMGPSGDRVGDLGDGLLGRLAKLAEELKPHLWHTPQLLVGGVVALLRREPTIAYYPIKRTLAEKLTQEAKQIWPKKTAPSAESQ